MVPVVSPLWWAFLSYAALRNHPATKYEMHSVSFRLLAPRLASVSRCVVHLAQDTRTVTEPKIPPACVTLAGRHRLKPRRHRRSPTSKSSPPPASRMRSTIARQGHGLVVLRAHGKKNVFLTGPLTLRTGVTLVVDKNTALVASRDPRLYDLSPGFLRHRLAARPRLQAAHHRRLTSRTPASWARAPSTPAAAQRSSAKTSPGGISRTKPKSKTSSRVSRQ